MVQIQCIQIQCIQIQMVFVFSAKIISVAPINHVDWENAGLVKISKCKSCISSNFEK